jgi:sarcosine oxidase
MQHFDAIVVGTGGVGSAALYHLACRGAAVLGIDPLEPGNDRGSSHGQTRLIRRVYYEHPSYVPLVERAYHLWAELEAVCGQTLLVPTGLLQTGRPESEVIAGCERSAAEHNLAVERLAPEEIRARWPMFVIDEAWIGLYESGAGYLHVEECVRVHAREAVARGATLATGTRVLRWQMQGSRISVETTAGSYTADHLILSAGAWSLPLLAAVGIELTVLRKPLYWYAPNTGPLAEAQLQIPAFLMETQNEAFYGFPAVDSRGVKLGRHSGGTQITDPDRLDRDIDRGEQTLVEEFAAAHLPELGTRCTDHCACMYTMTRDGHFLLGRHPSFPRVIVCAGLSGHGFKFTPVLGEAISQLALDGEARAPIAFLSPSRDGLAG